MSSSENGKEYKISHDIDHKVPFCIVNEHLNVLYSNTAFKSNIKDHDLESDDQPAGIFDLDTARHILPILKSESEERNWHGTITVKSRGSRLNTFNTLILPMDNDKTEEDVEFGCFFCDDTDFHRRNLRNVFNSLLEASKLKDNDTGNHIVRVNHYSKKLAEALRSAGWNEIDDGFLDNISFLASMHDVGKIGVPDDILNKPGRLESWERKIMEEHTINGAYILNHYPDPMARDIARAHHEWWDGSGYPHGLLGEMIPLSARIVAIADVYDALRSKRSYKDPIDHDETLQIMRSNKGTQFHKEIFEIFESISDDFRLIYDKLTD